MSWHDPTPPVLDFWKGLALLATSVLLTGALVYVLLR